MNPKRSFQTILLATFLGSLGYFFYVFTLNLIAGPGFTDDLKMALVLAGLSIGTLYLLRDQTIPDLPPLEELPSKDLPPENVNTDESDSDKSPE